MKHRSTTSVGKDVNYECMELGKIVFHLFVKYMSSRKYFEYVLLTERNFKEPQLILQIVLILYGLFMLRLNFLLLVICVLISVVLLTLLERKVLGFVQIREGPNKIGFVGIPQPFSNAIKLISKEQPIPIIFNYLLYYFSPVLNLVPCSLLLKGFLMNFGLFCFLFAETNRTPFDFAEGESELVSGFNIEYGASGFTLIFLSEYTIIVFMRMLFFYFIYLVKCFEKS
ncbi:NADH-ubiquinone oxidoreductase chain 1-like [Schistocerca americana]|uniref:NADH-ubiquinone oxidoreductase chain 1-like n=1 Tax=Schistocerca americana TaxID=7009 RepID=UPI001F4F3C1A|nr:NADH-ubiquinone oxidoreductase chain 1-like [Schistocerca americana]